MNPDTLNVFERAVALQKNGTPFVLVTVADLRGSAPCKPGFRMIVTGDGADSGTIGGGALEIRAVEEARRMLESGAGTQALSVDTAELGITPAEVTLLFESFAPADALWIFGGGHVCRSLVPLVTPLGFRVTVTDSRPEYARPGLFPGVTGARCRQYTGAIDDVPDGAFVVIMTHAHEYDFQLLRDAARREPPFAYVGMIGSVKKVSRAHEILREAGITPGTHVYTPIGLDLGAGGTAAEIALSIAAEIQAVRGGVPAANHCRGKVPFS